MSDRLKVVGDHIRKRIAAVEKEEARVEARVEIIESLKSESAELLAEADLVLKARVLLESYTAEESERLLKRIEGLVSRGLAVIFGPEYGFVIEMGQSRGQATTEFRIRLADGERDPMEAHGGGLVNVVSFVLRLVVAALTPGISKTLVLDEPFAQLSGGYLEGLGEFIRELVEATGIQLVIVSHEPEIAAVADKAYSLKRTGKGVVPEEI